MALVMMIGSNKLIGREESSSLGFSIEGTSNASIGSIQVNW
jgi:hypothetical protein